MMLTHTGRRTGTTYHTVLEVVDYQARGPTVTVMSGFGHAADWLKNIAASPPAVVTIGRRRFVADHHLLDVDEAAAVLQSYERRNRFLGAIVRKVLSVLVGWPYHGTDEERRRVVTELPLVRFAPAGEGTPLAPP